MKTLLCCIGRLENRYVREFVEHYKNIGFTNICLYDNNRDGEERFEEVIGDYIDSGFVILKDYRNQTVCQLKAYQECYDTYNGEYDWIAFFDIDEFLDLPEDKTIEKYLSREIFNDYDAIHVNWHIYGDSGQLDDTGGNLKDRLTIPAPLDVKVAYSWSENLHIKTIVRGGRSIQWARTPHTPWPETLKCCNAAGKTSKMTNPFADLDYSLASLRHYSTKTVTEYCAKMKRGFPDQKWNLDDKERLEELFRTRFFRTNEVTQEKIDIIKELMGLDMSFLLTHKAMQDEKSKEVKVYSLCYTKKDFEFIDDKFVTPLQVGASNLTDICELKDNTGDNISFANYFYVENTGLYWIWKNVKDAKYKGQMQYRRPFKGHYEVFEKIDEIFKDHDVITCEPFHHPDHMKPTKEEPMVIPASTVEGGYAFSNCLTDLLVLEQVVKHYYPDYAEDWDKYIKNGPDLYYSNGFVMRSEDYDKYVNFLFSCLTKWVTAMKINTKEELIAHVARNLGAGRYIRYDDPFTVPFEAIKWQTEIGGFLSERLWTLWLQHNIKPERVYKLPYLKMEDNMYT